MTPLMMLCAWLLATAPQAPAPGDVIADIRVHGNHLATDEEVIKLSGLVKGAPLGANDLKDAERKLKSSGQFDDVQVLKRFASIDDMSKVVVMLVVNEGAIKIDFYGDESPDPTLPRKITKRGWGKNFMYMPILDSEDGYGFRYGVRVAYAKPTGEHSRLSFPFTLGGDRRVGAEYEKLFMSGPVSRLELGGAISRRENPFYDEIDLRRKGWARLEKNVRYFRIGASSGYQRINFGGVVDKVKSFGGDVAIDTRLDPTLPRNAIYLKGGAERFVISGRDSVTQTKVDARAYLGLIGQTVLVGRIVREDADKPLPKYLKSWLGGQSNLRGFDAAEFVGDTLVAGSLELRMPLSTPLVTQSKAGLRFFADRGTVYDKGQRFEDQKLKTGYGAGVWMSVTVFHLNLDVAHGQGGKTRLHFWGGFTF